MYHADKTDVQMIMIRKKTWNRKNTIVQGINRKQLRHKQFTVTYRYFVDEAWPEFERQFPLTSSLHHWPSWGFPQFPSLFQTNAFTVPHTRSRFDDVQSDL